MNEYRGKSFQARGKSGPQRAASTAVEARASYSLGCPRTWKSSLMEPWRSTGMEIWLAPASPTLPLIFTIWDPIVGQNKTYNLRFWSALGLRQTMFKGTQSVTGRPK